MKTPGYKSTEFYLTLLAWALAGFLSSGALPEAHWAVKAASFLAAALTQWGYTGSRTKLKAGGGDAP